VHSLLPLQQQPPLLSSSCGGDGLPNMVPFKHPLLRANTSRPRFPPLTPRRRLQHMRNPHLMGVMRHRQRNQLMSPCGWRISPTSTTNTRHLQELRCLTMPTTRPLSSRGHRWQRCLGRTQRYTRCHRRLPRSLGNHRQESTYDFERHVHPPYLLISRLLIASFGSWWVI
jgi:hypothetical protein